MCMSIFGLFFLSKKKIYSFFAVVEREDPTCLLPTSLEKIGQAVLIVKMTSVY